MYKVKCFGYPVRSTVPLMYYELWFYEDPQSISREDFLVYMPVSAKIWRYEIGEEIDFVQNV